jgi:hypothetical protein
MNPDPREPTGNGDRAPASGASQVVAGLGIDRDELLAALDRTEHRLDPGNPEGSGHVRVIGHGEISVALEVADLPGLVCKRMSGYADAASASAYLDLVGEYLEELTAAGVSVVPTEAVPVPRADRPPVVYLVQPRLDPATLGHTLLHSADEATLAGAIGRALDTVAALAHKTATRADGVEVALDAQLSNWSFPDVLSKPGDQGPAPTAHQEVRGDQKVRGDQEAAPPRAAAPAPAPAPAPVLVDVGTPMMRRHGRHAMDREVLLAPVPAGLRAYYRRSGLVEAYLDDYFVPRTVALDLLGNFHKEGAPERIEPATEAVNDWLAAHDLPGPREPITVAEVEAYYRKDADLLALYLRLRRMDRFLRTRALRRPYDYVLPGKVRR